MYVCIYIYICMYVYIYMYYLEHERPCGQKGCHIPT